MQAHSYPTLTQASRIWARIGVLSFGGPAGQIALMHRILVEEQRWLGEKRFLHALNYCMLLPGPEAMQLAVYIGWLMHRTVGGLIAGVLFVLPGVIAIMGLSWVYALYGNLGLVEAVFFGLKAAVLAIVVQAVLRLGARALKNGALRAIAAVSFVAIFAFGLGFPLIVLGAGLIGFLGARAGLAAFAPAGHKGAAPARLVKDEDTLLGTQMPDHARLSPAHALRVSGVFLALWLGPVALLFAMLGPAHVLAQIAGFFSVLAVVSFGGAYAVLAWVAQEAVQGFGWLTPGEMLDGLGMAETTPGPLILVTQFVGFMAALRDGTGGLSLGAATLGGLLTVWVTFTPCFLWIFLGAPFIERLRDNVTLSAALGAITAAVVGVIVNLAVWFGLHVVFETVGTVRQFGLDLDVPVWASVNPVALGLVLVALGLVLRFNWGPVRLLSAAGLAGVALYGAGWI